MWGGRKRKKGKGRGRGGGRKGGEEKEEGEENYSRFQLRILPKGRQSFLKPGGWGQVKILKPMTLGVPGLSDRNRKDTTAL